MLWYVYGHATADTLRITALSVCINCKCMILENIGSNISLFFNVFIMRKF